MTELWESMLVRHIQLSLPKFTLEDELKLSKTLIDMGMPLAFSNADLTGMASDNSLYISEVFHKTFMSVDEKGTEAAAATAVVVQARGAQPKPIQFNADHPFIFMICHQQSKDILFMGRMVDPQ